MILNPQDSLEGMMIPPLWLPGLGIDDVSGFLFIGCAFYIVTGSGAVFPAWYNPSEANLAQLSLFPQLTFFRKPYFK